jgi:hypothetical protein
VGDQKMRVAVALCLLSSDVRSAASPSCSRTGQRAIRDAQEKSTIGSCFSSFATLDPL